MGLKTETDVKCLFELMLAVSSAAVVLQAGVVSLRLEMYRMD